MRHIIIHPAVVLLLTLTAFTSKAQELTQVLKGIVTDEASKKPLAGATITLTGVNNGATSNAEGMFVFKNVPIGRQKVVITYNGYKPIIIPEVLVTSRKEVILDASMEQRVSELGEVTVK